MFDTKIVFVIREDLAVWQKLNVTAFLATGIATESPEIMGQPYRDASGRQYGKLAGQPILVFSADTEGLRKVQVRGFERGLLMMPYIYPMFSTGNDDANREIFQAEPVENMDLVGLAMRGPKKVIDKVIKGLSLHK